MRANKTRPVRQENYTLLINYGEDSQAHNNMAILITLDRKSVHNRP